MLNQHVFVWDDVWEIQHIVVFHPGAVIQVPRAPGARVWTAAIGVGFHGPGRGSFERHVRHMLVVG